MVKHIVMFRLEGEGKDCAAREFKTAIEALPEKIEQLLTAEVGINDGPDNGNWDIVLTATCKDYADLATYAAHPEHIACVAIIKPLLAGRVCVDYTA